MMIRIHKRTNKDSTYYALYDTETWRQVVSAETDDSELNKRITELAFYNLDKKGYYKYMRNEYSEELKPIHDTCHCRGGDVEDE